jgi:hypothetical protein
MADYYPILVKAVASLPQNDAQARQDLYTRARTIVADQLRGRGVRRGASEAVSEHAALETAIRKVEAESQPVKAGMNGEPRRPAQRIAAAQERADDTARSLSKILQAVQPGEMSEATPRPSPHKSINGTPPPLQADAKTPTLGGDGTDESKEFGEAPNSLGTLLFATTYIVAALAFTGVTYIRAIVWLYQGVIGYPILLAIMAVTLGLFIIPPVMIFRKTPALPSIDLLMRYIHSASRTKS